MSLVDDVQRKLCDGWDLRFFKAGAGKGIWRVYKNNQPYKVRGLKFITINDSLDGHNYRRNVMKQLEEVGAIPPLFLERKPKERPPVQRSAPKENELQFALKKAQRFMNDPKSDGDLRGMSRDYLKLARLYVHVVKELKRERQRAADRASAT